MLSLAALIKARFNRSSFFCLLAILGFVIKYRDLDG